MNQSEKKNAPCKICPYKLGKVKTVINPCPNCKANGYDFYETIKAQSQETEYSEK
ncbi:MAG: hypothetical protein MR364_02330 [Oscillospiraceae bacterium]|nr:hypothetical protein [Oscillospiraceae bacterium]